MADQPHQLEDPRMPVPDGVPLPQRYWAILTIALGLTLAVLDGAIANVALPTIAHDVQRLAVGVDLGGERLPARGDDLPAAAGLAGGDLRLPPHLPGRPGGVHHRLPVLRPVQLADHADHGPRHPGLRRRRDHERQRRPGALHLSASLDRPRCRAECDDRLDRLGAGPNRRRRHPVGRDLALVCSRSTSRWA